MKTKELSKLSSLLFFTKESLRQLEKSENALDFNLKYWLKKEKIISLKRGLYVLKDRWEKEPDKQSYLEYLANKVYQPSYLSLEYVMNKYSLLTEAVWGITSITTKKTKTFTNKLGTFSYHSVSPFLFKGYELKKFYSADILIAKNVKAIFDYLYLRFLKKMPVNERVIQELRINWENIKRVEFVKIKKYAKKTKSRRINKVLNLIEKIYYA